MSNKEFNVIRNLYDNVIKMLNYRGFNVIPYNNSELLIRHQKTLDDKDNYQYLDIICDNGKKKCGIRFFYLDLI